MMRQTLAAAAATLRAQQIQLSASVWRTPASMPQSPRRQIRRSGVTGHQTWVQRYITAAFVVGPFTQLALVSTDA